MLIVEDSINAQHLHISRRAGARYIHHSLTWFLPDKRNDCAGCSSRDWSPGWLVLYSLSLISTKVTPSLSQSCIYYYISLLLPLLPSVTVTNEGGLIEWILGIQSSLLLPILRDINPLGLKKYFNLWPDDKNFYLHKIFLPFPDITFLELETELSAIESFSILFFQSKSCNTSTNTITPDLSLLVPFPFNLIVPWAIWMTVLSDRIRKIVCCDDNVIRQKGPARHYIQRSKCSNYTTLPSSSYHRERRRSSTESISLDWGFR